jgi:DNA primase
MSDNRRVDFAELRARADFRTVLAHYGVTPKGSAEQLKALCPLHDDQHASLSLNTREKVFHCFAPDCPAHAGGDVIAFVHLMETHRGSSGSLREAGLRLAAICGLELDSGKAPPRRQEGRRKARRRGTVRTTAEGPNRALAGGNGPQGAVPEGVPDQGQPRDEPESRPERESRNKPLGFTLSLDPAHPYLTAERGLSPVLIATFGLGFFAGEKGTMLGRVCVPIHNVEGELVAYAGRWSGPDETIPEGEEKYKLPKGFQKSLELFNLHRVKHCRHLVVVEGYFGAIRLHGLRVPTVALMGSSISDAQVTLLREHCPALRFVTVMLDAGAEDAAEKVAGRLAWHWPVRSVALPEGTQPDTVAEPEVLALLGRR